MRVSQTHTDATTKGGQIFSHIWRMKLQNFMLIFCLSGISFISVSSLGFYLKDLTWWQIREVYFGCYVVGVLEIEVWAHVQSFVREFTAQFSLELDSLLGRSPHPLTEINRDASPPVTALFIPPWNGTYVWKTVDFLREPWVQSIVREVYRCLLGGLGAGFLTTVGLALFFRKMAQNIETPQILEGQERVDEKTLAKRIQKTPTSLMLSPHLAFVQGTETEHTLFIGSTGQGKTNRIMDILHQIRCQGKRAVVLDITGEFTRCFFRQGQDKLLNPLDKRCERWTVWAENLKAHEYDAWAAAMVVENAHDAVWHETARRLLSITAQKLSEQESPSMKDILKWACWAPLNHETAQFYAQTPLASLMHKNAEKTTVGVRMNLAVGIDGLRYLEEEGTPFSIVEWMIQDTDEWLFLTALPSQRATLAPLLASWFNFAFLGLERGGVDLKRRMWFVVDELPGLRYRIDSLPRLVAEGRKYGACCLFGFQNKSQLDTLYGLHDAKAILSNCSTKVIFRTPEAQTAQYLSNTLGQLEIQESSENLSIGSHHMRDGVSLNQIKRTKAVVSPTEIMELEKFEAFVSLPGNLPIAKIKFPFINIEKTALSFMEK